MEDLYLANQVCFPLYAASKEIIRHYTPFSNRWILPIPSIL